MAEARGDKVRPHGRAKGARAPTARRREQALALLSPYAAGEDEKTLVPVVRDLLRAEDEDVFALMRGSGNEMGYFAMAAYLLRRRGLITMQDTMDMIDSRKERRRGREG